MKYTVRFILLLLIGVQIACGGNDNNSKKDVTTNKDASDIEIVNDESDAVEITQASTHIDLKNKGVGPITDVQLDDEINNDMVESGKELFGTFCSACHRVDKNFVGPSPKGITERRTPEWIMNMIMSPEVMVEEDPLARALLMEYNGAPMANQGISEEQARDILEYFRTL